MMFIRGIALLKNMVYALANTVVQDETALLEGALSNSMFIVTLCNMCLYFAILNR